MFIGISLAFLLVCIDPCHAQQIPTTRGTLLSGKSIALPQDLDRKFTILIVGFTEKSSESSSAWGKRVAITLGADRNVAWFAIPVLPDVPRLARGMVVRLMRRAVAPELQPSFLPLFESQLDWKDAVSFQAADDAYVLLVDRQGKILWKTHGVVSDDHIRELQDAIALE